MISSEIVSAVCSEILRDIDGAQSVDELEQVRVREFGKKGRVTLLMKELAGVPVEDRKSLGAMLNSSRNDLECSLIAKKNALSIESEFLKMSGEWIDVSLPVRSDISISSCGSLHPLTKVQKELESIFMGLGFTVVDGPEAETDYYNFEALNIPSTHPARDMQDTFFTTLGGLLRTHTSCIQARALEKLSPPLRIVAPGRCFRCERIDASHEHTFYQMEGMMVDKEITVGHLIYFMKTLLREIFGSEQKIRLRPGYFPFVEPGFELDIWFKGRWLELLPCGLVHPKVLEYGGIDASKWQGFAFGLGLSRLVMSRYQIDDIRHLQGGDLRFLKQFS